MKQHISQSQLDELNQAQRAVLFAWAIEKGYAKQINRIGGKPVYGFTCPCEYPESHTLPSIGQCIEFLTKPEHTEQQEEDQEDFREDWAYFQIDDEGGVSMRWERGEELIDQLWAAVKAKLLEMVK